MNKDSLGNPLSHMLEVPRNQLTSFHFVPSAQLVTTTKTSDDAGPSFLPVNTNGIIDASIRSPNYISSVAGHHAEVINATTVFTSAAQHQYGPLNMVTTNVSQQQQQQQQQQHVRVGISQGTIVTSSQMQSISIPISAVDNLSAMDAQFKYIEGKQLATTGTMQVGDGMERITVKIDPIDVTPLQSRAEEQLLHQQLAQHADAAYRGRAELSCVIKAEHIQQQQVSLPQTTASAAPSSGDDVVDRLLYTHVPAAVEGDTGAPSVTIKEEKPYKPFKCQQCPYETERKHRLKVHVMAIHTGEKPFKCSQCEYAAARKSTLKEHTLTIHSDLKPYECNECEYRTKKQSNLKVHLRAIHSNDKPYKCTECDYSAALKTLLRKHMDRFHSIDAKSFNPLQCLRYSKKRSNSTQAQQQQLEDQQQQQQQITQQIQVPETHPSLPEEAAIAVPAEQQQQQQLTQHVQQLQQEQQQKQHTQSIISGVTTVTEGSDKPFHCTLCGFRTARKSNLKAHISTVHLKEKPHKCSECDFMTARKASLRTHMSSIHSVGGKHANKS